MIEKVPNEGCDGKTWRSVEDGDVCEKDECVVCGWKSEECVEEFGKESGEGDKMASDHD